MATHPPGPTTLLIGLSGPSSSGKTTLARLLRQLFNFPSSSTSSSSPPPSLSLFILHQDDFYLTDALIPVVTTPTDSPSGLGQRQLQDWDCVESLDLDLLGRTLGFVRARGRLPVRSVTSTKKSGDGGDDDDEDGTNKEDRGDGDGPDWGESKEDRNSVGPVDLPEGLLEMLQAELEEWWREKVDALERLQLRSRGAATTAGAAAAEAQPAKEIRLCVLDGFLLYPDPNPDPVANANTNTSDLDHLPAASASTTATATAETSTHPLRTLHNAVTAQLALKLLVLSTRAQTIARRTRRTGYVTLEGFWEDPPGYVEDVVWPNWVRDGGWLMTMKTRDPLRAAEEVVEGKGEGEGEEQGELDPMVHVDERVAARAGISVAPGRGQVGLGELLRWAVDEVKGLVEGVVVAAAEEVS